MKYFSYFLFYLFLVISLGFAFQPGGSAFLSESVPCLILTIVLNSVTVQMYSPLNREKNLIKMTVGLAFVGLLLTSLLWFATSTMYDPCLETQECDTFQNVGYFSITDNEAVATLNDLKIPDPFSPRGLLDVQFINRGAVWPGMASYYTIIAERKELYGPYVLKKTLFSTEYFFESIFTMSLLLSLISLFVCLLIFLQRKLKLGRLSR
jgi:hypothetical protein